MSKQLAHSVGSAAAAAVTRVLSSTISASLRGAVMGLFRDRRDRRDLSVKVCWTLAVLECTIMKLLIQPSQPVSSF